MISRPNLTPLAALLVGLGVAAGAFGAHALRDLLAPNLMNAYEKGVLYQLIHSIALLTLAQSTLSDPIVRRASIFFISGVVIFSGSLYLLAITGQRWLGAITPIGGISFMLGWAYLAYATRQSAQK